jgi:hypothetical protein
MSKTFMDVSAWHLETMVKVPECLLAGETPERSGNRKQKYKVRLSIGNLVYGLTLP